MCASVRKNKSNISFSNYSRAERKEREEPDGVFEFQSLELEKAPLTELSWVINFSSSNDAQPGTDVFTHL